MAPQTSATACCNIILIEKMLARAAAVLRVAPRGAALVRPFASAADVAMAVDGPDFKKFATPVPQTFDHTEGLAGPATKVRMAKGCIHS